MARLPIVNGDDGTWGDILIDFLSVSLNGDGTIKTGALAGKADDSAVVHTTGNETVAGIKTFSSSPVVPTPTLGTQSANKTYVDGAVTAGAPDATTTNKGIVQLTGDLAGTAASPTVPGLATKQTLNANLTTIAGLSPANDDILQRRAGAWTNRTPAQFKTDLVLAKADVALGNVDNTSDANKPVSTAQATADALRVLKAGDTMTGALAITIATAAYALAINNGTTGNGITTALGTATNFAFNAAVTGDSFGRYSVDAAGKTLWGSGTLTGDTNLYRSAAGTLKTDGTFNAVTALQVNGVNVLTTATGDSTRVLKAGDTMTGALAMVTATATNSVLTANVTGDTFQRFTMDANGKLSWGTGTAAASAFLTRTGSGSFGLAGSDNGGLLGIGNSSSTGAATLQLYGGGGGANQDSIFSWFKAGTETWRDYLLGTADTRRYFRDMVNARMHITLTPGATATTSTTNISSNMTVDGGVAIAGSTTVNNQLTVTSGGAIGAQINGGVIRVYDPTLAYRSDIQMSAAGASFNSVTGSNGNLLPMIISASDHTWNVSTASVRALALSSTGVLSFGTTGDTNLYRSAASTLKTDGTFNAVTALQVNGVNVLTTGDTTRVLKAGDTMSGALAVTIAAAGYALALTNSSAGHGLSIGLGAATNLAYFAAVTGDSFGRYSVDASGKTSWGSGALAVDTNLYRSAANTLKTDNSLMITTRMAVGGTALDANVDLTSAKNITDPTAAQTGISSTKQTIITSNNAQTSVALASLQSTSANAFNYTGALRGTYSQIQFAGTGTASLVSGEEAILYNVGAGTITDGSAVTATIQNLNAAGIISNAYGLKVQLPFNTGTMTNTYGVYVGDITTGTQTNQAYGVYVSDANARNFFAGPVSFAGTTGFNGTAPAAKPTVTGSRGGNAALASLLTALAGTGLITDSTTA